MRKLIALTVVALTILATATFAVEVGDQPAISVRQGEVRTTPSFLGRIVATAGYGELVEVLELRGDWVRIRVQATNVEGWLHTTAIAEKQALRLEGAGDSRSAGTTSREIALAGRGFNEQVEARYKSEKGLDFTLVDEMEGYGLPPEELGEFFAAADLTFDEGGAE